MYPINPFPIAVDLSSKNSPLTVTEYHSRVLPQRIQILSHLAVQHARAGHMKAANMLFDQVDRLKVEMYLDRLEVTLVMNFPPISRRLLPKDKISLGAGYSWNTTTSEARDVVLSGEKDLFLKTVGILSICLQSGIGIHLQRGCGSANVNLHIHGDIENPTRFTQALAKRILMCLEDSEYLRKLATRSRGEHLPALPVARRHPKHVIHSAVMKG